MDQKDAYYRVIKNNSKESWVSLNQQRLKRDSYLNILIHSEAIQSQT